MIDEILLFRVVRTERTNSSSLTRATMQKNNRTKFNLFSYSIFFGTSIQHILGDQYAKETA